MDEQTICCWKFSSFIISLTIIGILLIIIDDQSTLVISITCTICLFLFCTSCYNNENDTSINEAVLDINDNNQGILPNITLNEVREDDDNILIKVTNINDIESNYNDCCPICLENIEPIESYKLSTCNIHIFHKNCLIEYKRNNFSICPLCNE